MVPLHSKRPMRSLKETYRSTTCFVNFAMISHLFQFETKCWVDALINTFLKFVLCFSSFYFYFFYFSAQTELFLNKYKTKTTIFSLDKIRTLPCFSLKLSSFFHYFSIYWIIFACHHLRYYQLLIFLRFFSVLLLFKLLFSKQ